MRIVTKFKDVKTIRQELQKLNGFKYDVYKNILEIKDIDYIAISHVILVYSGENSFAIDINAIEYFDIKEV